MREAFYAFTGRLFSFAPKYSGRFFCLLLFFLSGNSSFAQITDTAIDINSFKYQLVLDSIIQIKRAEKYTVPEDSIPRLKFALYKKNVKASLPRSWVEKDIFLRFRLVNNSDTPRTICFYPGFHFRQINLFKASPTNIDSTFQRVTDTLDDAKYPRYKIFEIQPQEEKFFYVQLVPLRYNTNLFMPRIMQIDFIEKHQVMASAKRSALDIVTYLACGILLMMVLYSLAIYLQNRGNEFLYYAGYVTCMGTLLFLISFLGNKSTPFNFLYVEYLDLVILCTGVFFYIIFIRKFLNTKINHPFLDKLMKIGDKIIVAMLVVFSSVYFFTDKFVILDIIEIVIKQFLLIIGIVFIVYGIRKKDKLINYLVVGNIALVFFSIVSFILLTGNFNIVDNPEFSLLNRPLFHYEVGLILELIFFLSGLAYKNRRDIAERVKEGERLKLDNERKEFEKQMAVMAAQQDERNRISADMHDELGSGVTAIRLMSEIVKSKMKDHSYAEIDKISNSANDLLSKMNTIIWTMKSSNDTLESLVAYIRAHATEFFDTTPIDCSIHVPETITDVEMSGEKRRNVFLSIKEALNNIMKHAQADKVIIDITTNGGKLIIKIADNGIGIDTEKLRRFGNGLSNMKRRMENIGGEFKAESNHGAVLTFSLPI